MNVTILMCIDSLPVANESPLNISPLFFSLSDQATVSPGLERNAHPAVCAPTMPKAKIRQIVTKESPAPDPTAPQHRASPPRSQSIPTNDVGTAHAIGPRISLSYVHRLVALYAQEVMSASVEIFLPVPHVLPVALSPSDQLQDRISHGRHGSRSVRGR